MKRAMNEKIVNLIVKFLSNPDYKISAKESKIDFGILTKEKILIESSPLVKVDCPNCRDHPIDINYDASTRLYSGTCEHTNALKIFEASELNSFEITETQFFKWLTKKLDLILYENPYEQEEIKVIAETRGINTSYKVAFIFTDNHQKVIASIKKLSSEKSIIYFWLGRTPIIGRISNVFSLYDVLFVENNELKVNKDVFKSLDGYEPKKTEGFVLGENIFIQKEDSKHFLKFNYDQSFDVYRSSVGISPLQYRILRHFFDNFDESYTTGDLAKEGLTSVNKASNEISSLNKKCTDNDLQEILAKLTKGSDKYSVNPALHTT